MTNTHTGARAPIQCHYRAARRAVVIAMVALACMLAVPGPALAAPASTPDARNDVAIHDAATNITTVGAYAYDLKSVSVRHTLRSVIVRTDLYRGAPPADAVRIYIDTDADTQADYFYGWESFKGLATLDDPTGIHSVGCSGVTQRGSYRLGYLQAKSPRPCLHRPARVRVRSAFHIYWFRGPSTSPSGPKTEPARPPGWLPADRNPVPSSAHRTGP